MDTNRTLFERKRKIDELFTLVQGHLDSLCTLRSQHGVGAVRGLEEMCIVHLQQEEFVFSFKNRDTHGQAIHIAALHYHGAAIVRSLLSLRLATVEQECRALAFNQESRLKPIHLAAAMGNLETVKILVSFRADVEAITTHGGVPHYGPLHEAAVHARNDAVKCLLELNASPLSLNKKHETPLHLAARMGSSDIAETLVRADADLNMVDAQGLTPLAVALRSDFPDRKLHLLAAPNIDVLRGVARIDPRGALALISNQSWREEYMSNPMRTSVADMVELLRTAPKVAEVLFDVLSVEPVATDKFHHPIPKYGVKKLTSYSRFQCEYTVDKKWKYDASSDTDTYPAWHDNLVTPAPTPSLAAEQDAERANSFVLPQRVERVRVRMFKVPNPVCVDMLLALSELSGRRHRGIFNCTVVQAIVDFAWLKVVRKVHSVKICIRVIEILALLVAARESHENLTGGADEDSSFSRYWVWSYLFASTLRDFANEISQFYGFYKIGCTSAYLKSVKEFSDIVVIVLTAILLWKGLDGFTVRPGELLAVVSFFKWIDVLYMLRGYSFLGLGRNIIPIFQSIFASEVKGMFVILFFMLVAFVHSYLALDSTLTVSETLLNAFKLLLTLDGDGINFVLDLGAERGSLQTFREVWFYFTVLVFCICILNLFIAVHGQAYAGACSTITQELYLNRTDLCLEAWVRPRVRKKLSLGPWPCWTLIIVPAVILWSVLLHHVPRKNQRLFMLVVSGGLFLAMIVGDAFLRMLPWHESGVESIWHVIPSRTVVLKPLADFAKRVSTPRNKTTVVGILPPTSGPCFPAAASEAEPKTLRPSLTCSDLIVDPTADEGDGDSSYLWWSYWENKSGRFEDNSRDSDEEDLDLEEEQADGGSNSSAEKEAAMAESMARLTQRLDQLQASVDNLVVSSLASTAPVLQSGQHNLHVSSLASTVPIHVGGSVQGGLHQGPRSGRALADKSAAVDIGHINGLQLLT
eukprot:TRINITY_DN80907_c0_g1_i1.p1 TRINITY_DN80907_c0_g1~~TRINITY_DN80907_c0_g1_i1.p1  ORF type:complete len:990 (-),score=161.85 TRINITY_DN80907_c0_g1_i1:380-3316(-)